MEKLKKYSIPFIVLILITISTIIRIPKKTEEYNNNDATYHVLYTMQCYNETKITTHKFLPIVSLGDKQDKYIPWGACIEGNRGNYYYTSFSPVGFVAPYLFVKVFNLPINIYSLYAFNSIIQIITLILTIYIFYKLFSKYLSKNVIILCTSLIYLFQIEVMHSQGVIYWIHSIFQLLLALQFIFYLNYKNSKKSKIAFFIMCLIMPYAEWTGYISNIGFALILFLEDIIKNKKLRLKSFLAPLGIGILTIASFGLFSLHFLLNVDIENYFYALKARFFARNTVSTKANIGLLLKGYYMSYGYMILLCVALLMAILSIKKYRQHLLELIKEYKYVIIFFTFILLENIIMLQHAIEYTFDRLKFIYILISIFFILIITIYNIIKEDKKIFIHFIVAILAIIAITNLVQYKQGINNYVRINTYYENNNKFAEYIKENYKKSNSIMCSNTSIRGYMNLLFERGIYEWQTYGTAQEQTKKNKKRYLIYVEKYGGGDNLVIKKITVKDMNKNKEKVITISNGELVVKKK